VHWDGDRPLFISVAGFPASAHIYLGTEGAIQLNGTTLTALDVFDRDWSGNMVTSHWVQKGSVGYSSWQQFSVKSPTPGGKGQISGTCYYPILGSGSPPPGFTVCNLQTQVVNYPYETNNESSYPIPRRDDGLELGEISIQGVRTMDVSTTQWTTPDAYAGDVHDPMSQRPFMWNGNNLYSYSDPSGYDPEEVLRFGFNIQDNTFVTPNGVTPLGIEKTSKPKTQAQINAAAHGKIIGGTIGIGVAATVGIPGEVGGPVGHAALSAAVDAGTQTAGEKIGAAIGDGLAGITGKDPGPVSPAVQRAYDLLGITSYARDLAKIAQKQVAASAKNLAKKGK
jgi:hypothetical protein